MIFILSVNREIDYNQNLLVCMYQAISLFVRSKEEREADLLSWR